MLVSSKDRKSSAANQWVPRLALIVSVSLIAVLAFYGPHAVGSEGYLPGIGQSSPSVDLQESSFDFGEVFSGEVISHTFKVKNTGPAVLDLKFKDAQTPGSVQAPHTQSALRLHSYSGYGIKPAVYAPGEPLLAASPRLPSAAPI